MSFLEHLVELRTRIIQSLIGIGAGVVVGLLLSNKVFDYHRPADVASASRSAF